MLPKAKQAYDLLHESYKARRAAWPDVLMAQRQYLSLRAEQINNQLMYRESDVAVRGMLLTGGLTSPPPPVGAGHIDAVAKPRQVQLRLRSRQIAAVHGHFGISTRIRQNGRERNYGQFQ